MNGKKALRKDVTALRKIMSQIDGSEDTSRTHARELNDSNTGGRAPP